MTLAAASLAGGARAASATTWSTFSNPQAVAIAGYPGSAEEPFISPDGRYLLFNSSEAEPNFSLQYALASATVAGKTSPKVAADGYTYE